MSNSSSVIDRYLVLLGGPTGVGKTELSIELAKHWATEIISVDSRQIYKEMQIGTAKPTTEQLDQVPHHFINEKSISERYTAADYERDALKRLDGLFQKKNIVLAVGGTGLYMRALMHGFDEIPDVSPEITARIRSMYDNEGQDYLVDQLKKVDPVYAETADLKNPHRVQRALSVFEETGQPFSSYLSGKNKKRPFKVITTCLTRERTKLYERIDRRVDEMIEEGLVDEVQSLLKYRDQQAMQTVGYQELFGFFDGTDELTDSIERIKRNSRRYAKRQMTWFRNQGDWNFFSLEEENVKTALIQFVQDSITSSK